MTSPVGAFELFKEELKIDRPIVAYSRPRNLGDHVTKAKLHQAPGETSSIIIWGGIDLD